MKYPKFIVARPHMSVLFLGYGASIVNNINLTLTDMIWDVHIERGRARDP